MTLMSEDLLFWNDIIGSDQNISTVDIQPNFINNFLNFWIYQAYFTSDITSIDFEVNECLSCLDFLNNYKYIKTCKKRFSSFSDEISKMPPLFNVEHNHMHMSNSVLYDVENLDEPKLIQISLQKNNSFPLLNSKNKMDVKALKFFNILMQLPDDETIFILCKGPTIIPKEYVNIYKFIFVTFGLHFNDFKSIIDLIREKYCKDSVYSYLDVSVNVPCDICCIKNIGSFKLKCCELTFCVTCLKTHVNSKVELGNIQIVCMNTDCDEIIPFSVVWLLLTEENRHIYDVIKNKQSENDFRKRCPNCLEFYELSPKEINHTKTNKSLLNLWKNIDVNCKKCSYKWCFTCQFPPHPSKCSNRNTNKLLNQWAKLQIQTDHSRHRKARKCPACKTLTERNGGCNHIICSECQMEWCFNCGAKLKMNSVCTLLFSHNNKYSITGCPKLIRNPIKRILIRWSLFIGISFGAVVGVLILLPLVPFGLICFCGYNLYAVRNH